MSVELTACTSVVNRSTVSTDIRLVQTIILTNRNYIYNRSSSFRNGTLILHLIKWRTYIGEHICYAFFFLYLEEKK